jgi:anti-sigma B factor antagonist
VREGKVRSRDRFSCSIGEESGTAVLYCSGGICFREEARKFSQAAVGLLEKRTGLVLEFSSVKVMDSAGIGELVLVHMQARAFECAVRLVAPSLRVRKLLELTNVASLFEIFPDVASATASLKTELV